MAMKVMVSVPATARKGDAVEIKAMAMHPMENGLRRDMDGKVIPRFILKKFECRYNGELVVDCDWHTAISANPYMSFFVKAVDSGKIEFAWTDDNGAVERHTANISVT
jgi:sulfur-oxidizing protein SoxZ